MRTIARKAIAYGILVFCAAATGQVAAKAPTIIQLRRVQVADGLKVTLVFDGSMDLSKIRTEFFNDIIQLSMTDVSVYPAKITSVAGTELSKVFAYQYAPGLTRIRFTVRGKAEDFKRTLKLQPSGNMLTVELAGSLAQAPVAAAPAPSLAVKAAEPVIASAPSLRAFPPAEKVEAKSTPFLTEKKPLASGRPLPSPWRAFGVLGGIVSLLLGLAWVIRRARGDRVSTHHKFPRFAANLLKKLGASNDGKKPAIEVLASHALGPKKSISVVRVSGRILVLGVTDDAINLISELTDTGSGDDVLVDSVLRNTVRAAPSATAPAGAVSAGPAIFADIFQMESEKPAAQLVSNRNRIRSRLEGMKEI